MALKIGGQKIKPGSPQAVCVIYPLISFAVIILFRFVYPDFSDPGLLEIFWYKARWTQGVLTYIKLFPAIFTSALMLPFAMNVTNAKVTEKKRFSPKFFDTMRPYFMCALAGAGVYAILCFIAGPLSESYRGRIQVESRVYNVAREKAASFAAEEKWEDAAAFFAICGRVWPDDPASRALGDSISGGLERVRYGRDAESAKAARTNVIALPGRGAPVNEREALRLAREALDAGRDYDAHWLANTAMRLAVPGSMEASESARLSSLAWNAISRPGVSEDEKTLFSIYRRKREAYEALVNNEWVRAYYSFSALLADAPADPDVKNYLAVSEKGLLGTAFFIDEADRAVGNLTHDAVLSIPGENGRFVMRFESIVFFDDAAFGRGYEAFAFSPDNKPLYRVSADLVKITPVSVNGQWRTIFLFHAIDRKNAGIEKNAVWSASGGAIPVTAGRSGGSQQLVYAPYEELILATEARDGAEGFFLRDLWDASQALNKDGFVSETFIVRILGVLAEVVYFPALAVFAILIGWNYRARFRVRYSLLVMPILLPAILLPTGELLRDIFHAACIWVVVSYGTTVSFIAVFVSAFICFSITAFILAARRVE